MMEQNPVNQLTETMKTLIIQPIEKPENNFAFTRIPINQVNIIPNQQKEKINNMKTILLPCTMQNNPIASDTCQQVSNFAGNVGSNQHPTANSRHRAKWHFASLARLLAFTLLISFAYAQFTFAGPGPAWPYVRPVMLSPVTPSANFQVKVTLVAGQYTNMNSDGSDLRFYDKEGNNCEYWIEGAFNTAVTSIIWVKVPTSGENQILLYYGNASATAASNGLTTFDYFDGFDGSSLGANWAKDASGGSIGVTGSQVTLSNTSTGSVNISSQFTTSSTSFLLETKHKEGAYNRNRLYASTSLSGQSPTGFDYGYFYNGSGARSSAQVFWNGYQSTSLSSNTDYLTQWRITDGSTYNWYLYNYSTGATLDSRTTTTASIIRYITYNVNEVASTSIIVDWVRVRKYTASEPVATVYNDGSTAFNTSGNFIVPAGVTSITVQCWGAGGGGSTITSSSGRGGGGGGGAFASGTLTVSPGLPYAFTVGTGGAANTAGGNSTFNSTSVVAAGGGGGTNNSATPGAGGTTTASTGTTKNAGGDGATGGSTYSGGGGGGAGTSGAGGLAPTAGSGTYGSGTSNYGGNGGASVSGGAIGNNGSTYGGGGSGASANSSTDRTGGSGASGQVSVTWTPCPAPTATLSGGSSLICYNTSPADFSVTPGSGDGNNYTYLWYKNGISTGITTTTYNPGALTANTTIYCAVTSCGTITNSATYTITVYGNLTAGISGGTTPTCYNTSPGTLTATGTGGTGTYSYLWYKDDISTGITTSTYDPGNLTSNTNIYCAVTSGSCGTVNTSTKAITLDPVTVGGVLTGGTTAICYGYSTGTLTLSGHTGTIIKWQKKHDSGSWTDITNTNNTYSETPSSPGTFRSRSSGTRQHLFPGSGRCSRRSRRCSRSWVCPTDRPPPGRAV